jgi:5'-methylthioinosine phosphorylase
MLGIIGGSGLDQIRDFQLTQQRHVPTPYGEPSAPLSCGRLDGREWVFLPRHGSEHSIAPHRINYRANIWALQAQGVRRIVSIAAVGGITAALLPGTLVVPDQLIDYTHGRESTFLDGIDKPLAHIDFTSPFSPILRQRLLQAAHAANEIMCDGGTYGVTQGPRLETAAEIDRLDRDGATMVGMTGMPEAVLARELELDYAMLAVVVNAAAGRGGSTQGIAIDEINAVAAAAMVRVLKILSNLEPEDGD